MLSQKAVDEFKAIMKREYGVEFSDKEAWESAMNLLQFFGAFVKIAEQEAKGG